MNDPIQEPVTNQGTYTWQYSSGQFLITQEAYYSVAAMVMSKKNYHWGWQAKLLPIDLALAWGELVEPEVQKYITYSQNNRWYYYVYKRDCPVDGSYITSHSSNHHLMASNENVLAALMTIKINDMVKLDGFLVDVSGRYEGRQYLLKSSLSRNDTGAGAWRSLWIIKYRLERRFTNRTFNFNVVNRRQRRFRLVTGSSFFGRINSVNFPFRKFPINSLKQSVEI